ncbi:MULTISPECIES: protein-tyrosine phosphatase family protein [Pirellulaceae]|uniref:protein-tyrosine phosphatase family protein n=1 Tax=Pirellulaceae TaxID=2691357 RepID=UPI001E5276BB|nr:MULTISPECIES: protein-tyrosine phosphatase family protein [Pirellulaceae]
MKHRLADKSSTPPTPFSYWVIPSQLLAGAYPGYPDPVEHEVRIDTLVDAGIRRFVNLMEVDEANDKGQSFVPYQEIAEKRSPGTTMHRYAIPDLSVPSTNLMNDILDSIDASLAAEAPVYVHCWGGVGRTGTVIGCWLLLHGLAEPESVLDILQGLRNRDLERGHRKSPETREQREFVRHWIHRETR